jgi:CheY-like chemotaxis protein
MIAMQDGLRVLFVEDEPLVRQATAQSLELAGFAVLALPSAEAAMPHLAPISRRAGDRCALSGARAGPAAALPQWRRACR